MASQQLALSLVRADRLGMTPEVARSLGVESEAETAALLTKIASESAGLLGVYLLGVFVIDDTDLWSDGELYWFSIPTLVKRGGAEMRTTWGLPDAAEPVQCGSGSWLSSVDLDHPPLLAIVPLWDDVESCVIRFGLYDDDVLPANIGGAAAALFAELTSAPREATSASELVGPLAERFLERAGAAQDDVLHDREIEIARAGAARFSAGFVASSVTAKARVHLFVRDEQKTEQAGPVSVFPGHGARIHFGSRLVPGARICFFACGADVTISSIGVLGESGPFLNRTVDAKLAEASEEGFVIHSVGRATVVAFYTPR